MSKFKHLFSSIRVGTHTYKNRIIAAPIYCGTFINVPNLDYVMKHAMKVRADGGAAQVTLGETAVNFRGASREPLPPIDYTNFHDPTMAKLKELASYIKSRDAKCLIELSHCGESVESIPGVKFGIGPMGYTRKDGMVIYAMDEKMMDDVIQDFITAAKFMKEAGMDGVMIHCGHGWLLHQFLSPRTNKRSDRFGGSLENRARFPLMLLKKVREAMGKDFILEIRVSGEEAMGESGMHIDETVEFCKMAQQYADLIHVSVGVYRNPILSGEFSSLFQPHGLNAEAAKAIKQAVDIPVVVVGGINDPKQADEMIASGICDFVALARQLTADPYFPKKAQADQEEDINPCLRCFKCFPGPLEGVDITQMHQIYGCSVNPEEFCYDFDLLKSKPGKPKKVLVVGGGIAGMTAAITAHDRGHQVTLADKRSELGGVLFFTDMDYYKKDLNRFKYVLENRIRKRNISVRLNCKVTPREIREGGYDHIILALGASPVTPPIRGIQSAHQALDFYRGVKPEGKNILMIGGGLVGCETALDMARQGYHVEVIEMGDKVAPDSYPMHRIGLLNEMEDLVSWRCSLKCLEIKGTSILCENEQHQTVELEADSIFYALGMKANEEAVKELSAASDVPVSIIGDCKKAAKVYEAGRQGWEAAMRL